MPERCIHQRAKDGGRIAYFALHSYTTESSMKAAPIFLTLILVSFPAALRSADTDMLTRQRIDPSTIEASLVPEKNAINIGEPIFVTFTLLNNGKRDLGVNLGDRIYFDAPSDPKSYFKFTITDAQGHELAQIPGHGPGMTVVSLPVPCKLTAGGEYTAPLFLPMRVVFDKPGDYAISVTKTAEFSLPTDPQKSLFGYTAALLTIDKTATANIKVVPADTEKMGRLIDALGEKLVANGKSTTQDQMEHARIDKDWFHGGLKAGDGYLLLTKFTAIHDERVIPWLLRTATTTSNISFREETLRALATFNSDAAFDALKTAMATPAKDVPNAPFNTNEDSKAALIPPDTIFRTTVLSAITDCQNPGAIPYALTFRHDPYAGMRGCVVYMACLRMKPEESVPVLRELAGDTDHNISSEAKAGLYRACRQIKPEEAIPILRELAGDSNVELSTAVKAALGEARKKLESGSSSQ